MKSCLGFAESLSTIISSCFVYKLFGWYPQKKMNSKNKTKRCATTFDICCCNKVETTQSSVVFKCETEQKKKNPEKCSVEREKQNRKQGTRNPQGAGVGCRRTRDSRRQWSNGRPSLFLFHQRETREKWKKTSMCRYEI